MSSPAARIHSRPVDRRSHFPSAGGNVVNAARLPDRILGIVLVLAAGAAFAYALPFGLSRIAELPGNGAARLVYAGERPVEEGYVRLLDSREAALGWAERAGPHRDLGHAYHVLAAELGDIEDMRRELLTRARRELSETVARSPADPAALVVLGASLLGLERDDEARSWVRTAQRIAPYSPETALLRSWITLVATADRSALTEPDRRDFRAAFRHDRDRFVQMVVELEADQVALSAFEGTEHHYDLKVALMRAREESPVDRPGSRG